MPAKSASAAAAPEGKAVLAPEQAAALRQVDARKAAAERAVAEAVRGWWFGHIHNSPLAQATEAYAHAYSRLDALTAAVLNALKEV